MPVKCFVHPDQDAIYDCAYCGKAICGDCMRFVEDEDGTVICSECTTEAVLEISSEDFEKDVIEKVELQKRVRSLSKMRVEDVMNIWLLGLLVVFGAVNAYINHYLSLSVPGIQMTDKVIQTAGDPTLEFSMFLNGIFAYAADHSGRYPEKLNDLYPDYVSKAAPTILSTKESYSYAADRKNGFVLNCTVADRFGYKKMYATREGVVHLE